MTFHEDMKYWVWLQRAAGKGANLERLLSPFGGDVRALYEADPGERERLLRETPSESADWQREEAMAPGCSSWALPLPLTCICHSQTVDCPPG